MITRRAFLQLGIASLGALLVRCVPAGATPTPTPSPLPGTPWAFDGPGLCFPAYFLTNEQRRQLVLDTHYPHRLHLPLVTNG